MALRHLLASFVLGSALLVGVSARAEQVVIYTAAKSSDVDALTARFQRETGITTQVVKGGSGDLVRRAQAERAAPKGDVIWSIGGEQLEASKDLLTPFVPAEVAAIAPAYNISPIWAPYSAIVVSFSVNTEALKPSEYPHSWKDLADPRWKGKITSARADSSGSAFQQYATVLTIYGAEGPALYKKILDNFTFAPSSGVVNRLVNDGEAQVGVTLEDDAFQYKNGGGPVDVVYPDDGTSTTADAMGLIKGGPNPEAGKKLLNWLLTKPVQEFIVAETGRRSVRSDVASRGTPLTSIKLAKYDILKVAADRDALMKQWQTMAAGR